MSLLAPANSEYVLEDFDAQGITIRQLRDQGVVPFDYNDVGYASPVSGLQQSGFLAVYRNNSVSTVKKFFAPGFETYHGMIQHSVRNHGDLPALSLRTYDYKTNQSGAYETITYNQLDERRKALGSGLLFLLQNNPYKVPGLESHEKISTHAANYQSYDANNHSFIVTLFAQNRAEWILTDITCASFSITSTALYDTLGPGTSKYILELTSSPVVIALGIHIRTLLDLKRTSPKELEALISVVSMDPLSEVYGEQGKQQLIDEAKALNIMLYDFEQVLEVGRIFPHADLPPKSTTQYTISFTSGTTGSKPKGVVLTHSNLAGAVAFLVCQVPSIQNYKDFCFLPLAHIFQRHCTASSLMIGATVGFPQLGGTPLTLLEDLKLFKPTYMSNVPRVFTKFEAAIKSATIHSDKALAKSIFTRLINNKMEKQASAENEKGSHWLYDRVLAPKLRKALGFDEMEWTVTGLAPISPLTVKFLKAALNIGFSQGYGLTETFAGISFSVPFEKEPGSCGAIGVASEISLRDLPSLGYSVDGEDPAGELLIRGPQVFSHYFKNPEETNKALKDGWFYTGDVARIDGKTGRYYIVDRVKNFFKLAHGEYVTPEKVENNYLSSNSILTQAFAHGESVQSYLVGIIGVEEPKAKDFLIRKCNVPASALMTPEAILEQINQRENRTILLEDLNRNVQGLFDFEKLHNIYIEYEPLRLERDVVTPTVKIKRPVAAKFFKDQIAAMYSEGKLTEAQAKI